MDSKKLALVLASIGLALVGCDGGGTGDGGSTATFPARDNVCEDGASPPCETNTPAASEEQRTVAVDESMEAETRLYVVELISLPEASDPDGPGPQREQAAGFNLDGLDSGEGSSEPDANCEQFNTDYVAVTDSAHVGVDNALQGLVGTIEGLLSAEDCPGGTTDGCLDAQLQEQIADGSLLLMMEVSGINNYTNDTSVMLRLFLGATPDGSPPVIESDGTLEAGQTFVEETALGPEVQGDIFQGRLRATTDLLTIEINTGDFALPLMISNAEVRFDITESALTGGAIGGYLTTQSIIDAASMIMPGIEETVRSVVESVADIDPSAENPEVCDSVSVGLTFDATTAVEG